MRKETGSYYTSQKVADFIVKYLFKHYRRREVSLLEPSVGDGVFLQSVERVVRNRDLRAEATCYDINGEAIQNVHKHLDGGTLKIHSYAKDFLDNYADAGVFDMVIGNPPYVRKRFLSDKSIDLCKRVHANFSMEGKSINNIWTSFVLASSSILKDNGVLAFVLPVDILQVKYAVEIREFLEHRFVRIEIMHLGFGEFEDADQETVIVIAKKQAKQKGTYFYKVEDFSKGKIKEVSDNGLMICDLKWTHFQLTKQEIKLLNKVRKRMGKIADYTTSKAGIVTGANDYFIVNKSKLKDVGATRFSKPIISGSRHMTTADFTANQYDDLYAENERVSLIDLSSRNKNVKNEKLDRYLDYGESSGINERYKCSQRTQWHNVPNIGKPASAFIFKRAHYFLKLVKNSASVFVTDIAYEVEAKPDYEIDHIIASFYNGITLIFSELTGRRYGGGVLEVTPNEFRELPFIYNRFSPEELCKRMNAIKFDSVDYDLFFPEWLLKTLELDSKDRRVLEAIYTKLLNERISNKKTA